MILHHARPQYGSTSAASGWDQEQLQATQPDTAAVFETADVTKHTTACGETLPSHLGRAAVGAGALMALGAFGFGRAPPPPTPRRFATVTYTHPRAHETVLDIACRLLREKKKKRRQENGKKILGFFNDNL